ncbi:hypothetical protein EON65_14790 [archaeon]|nr:MAG: hypothetical protein EON65_14790 [archaeon]
MQGYNIFNKSLNGIRSIRGDNIIASSGIYDSLTTNTLSVGELISNLTQGGVYTITQSGTNSNIFKDSNFTNITISGNLTSNLLQSSTYVITQTGSGSNTLKNTSVAGTLNVSGTSSLASLSLSGNVTSNLTQGGSNIISQTGSSTNQLKNTTVTGQLGLAGNLVQSSGSNTLYEFTMPNQQSIVQQGSGTGGSSQNTFRTINMPTNGHIINQGGSGTNIFKQSNFSAAVSIAGNLTQSSGSSSLLNLSCHNITQSSNSSIIQSGVTSNALGSTTISDLIVTSSMSFPGSVTIPSATINDDFTITGDGRILQDQTSLTVNIIKSTNIKSLIVEESILQNSGTATLCDVFCDTLNTKEFNLLDSGGSIVVSDSEMRFIAGVTSSIQTQIDSCVSINTTQQSEIDNLQSDLDSITDHVTSTVQDQLDSIVAVNNTQTTDIADLQEQIDDIIAVNDTQTNSIADLQTQINDLEIDHDDHVANAVLLTTDQSIAGSKSFTSTLTTNGITNEGIISSSKLEIGDSIRTYKKTVQNFISPISSIGTTDLLVCSFDAVYFRRSVNLTFPFSIYMSMTNTVSTTFWLIEIQSITLSLYKNDVFEQTLTYSSSWPHSNNDILISTNSLSMNTLEYFYATLSTNFDITEETEANYKVYLTLATYDISCTPHNPTPNIHSFGLKVNTDILSSSITNGSFSPSSPSSDYQTTTHTTPVSLDTQILDDGNELNLGIIRAQEVHMSFSNIVPQFTPCNIITGTTFSSNSATQVNENHSNNFICCSMIRIGTTNSDKAIVLYPNYSIKVYKSTSYSGSTTTLCNHSNQIASIRTNQLNTDGVAIYENGSWSGVAAINSGSFGQNSISSIKLYYGSISLGTQVEITSSIFS